MSNSQQTDSEIHGDHLHNVLVDTLTQAFNLNLDNIAEIDAEDIFEVLVGAGADETSVSTLCEKSEKPLHENSIFHHFRTKFVLDLVEFVGNVLLQKEVLATFPEQWRSSQIST